jgi:hypothetical protein
LLITLHCDHHALMHGPPPLFRLPPLSALRFALLCCCQPACAAQVRLTCS